MIFLFFKTSLALLEAELAPFKDWEEMQIFGPEMGPGGRPEARPAMGSTQKCCLFGVQS